MNRSSFLIFAGVFEGGLLLTAFIVGSIFQIDPFACFVWSASDLAKGVVATGPLLILFYVLYTLPIPALREIKSFLIQTLGPILDDSRWYDLVLFALLAGLCEEMLFRGILQPLFGRMGPPWGLVISNVLFGLAHAVTPLYAALAGGIGLYLGLLPNTGDHCNLLTPITTHALYDYLAFLIVQRSYRRRGDQASATSET